MAKCRVINKGPNHRNQHGFRKGRSCLTNLLEFLEEVYKKLDEGRAVGVVGRYLDCKSSAIYRAMGLRKELDKLPAAVREIQEEAD